MTLNIRRLHTGFTLIELIIALLILSMVMVLCASGFRFGIRIWDTIDRQAAQIDNLQATQGFLRKSISSALIRDPIEADEEDIPGHLFLGEDQSLRYVSYSPQYGVDDYLYAYELYHDTKTKSLRLKYRPYNLLYQDNDDIDRFSTIAQQVEDIKIEYFSGFQTSNNGWSSQWNREFVLPLLVKVSVILEDTQSPWPELIIQMRNGPYVVR